MSFTSVYVVLIFALSIYAEARRGLAFALFDLLRILLALAAGLFGYSLGFKLFHSYTAGLMGFLVSAVLVIVLLAGLLKLSKLNPAWGKTLIARIVAAGIGGLLGYAICMVTLPILGRVPLLANDVTGTALARPFLNGLPGVYYAADAVNLELPQLNRRAVRFEDEGKPEQAVFARRINYLRLSGSMCIECRTPVRFLGYRLRNGLSVSPEFECPNCGRTSDGCQTFEGFHTMYHRCPIEVAHGAIAIDCGVWPNNRPIQPRGKCPVCGRNVKSQ